MGEKISTNQGTTRAISSFIDPSLNWNDMPFFKSITKMPIILKGIQTGEDAIRAYEVGMDGMVVSNHGGRQLDYARSGIEMLVECMDALRSIGADLDKFTVLVDGGFRRGSDFSKPWLWERKVRASVVHLWLAWLLMEIRAWTKLYRFSKMKW